MSETPKNIENGATIVEIPNGTDFRADAERNFWSNIRWHTLFCLLEFKGHLPITELAKTAGLKIDDAVIALESMQTIGLIARTATGFSQVSGSFKRVGLNRQSRMEIISQFVLSTNQVNNRILESLSQGEHKTKCLTYNSKQELVDELYSNIQKAIDEFKKKSDAAKQSWDGVYNLSASLIKMTEDLL